MRRDYLEYRHWEAAKNDPAWRWTFFSPYEMRCHATERLKVGITFMNRLQHIRVNYGKPIVVVSGYRTPDHNAEVTGNGSRSGAHTFGRAVDIVPDGGVADVPLILQLAWTFGMTRCGMMISRDRWKFHLDDMTEPEGFAVRDDSKGLFCWTY